MTASTADAPNRFSVEFQDSFNEYQHDSFSLVDIEDSLATGQETTAMLPALGLPNFDQAARITKLQLLKSIKGNQYVEFGTSVRGFHLRPGDIITLTYLREGLDRTPFRIARIAPGANYRTAQITAQRHNDQWYLETSGDGGNSNGREPSYEIGLPRPLVGTILDNEGIPQFGVVEKRIETTDGGGTISLEVAYKQPRRVIASRAGIPMLALAPVVETTNGTLVGNQTLYYSITGNDSNGDESSSSFIVRARVAAETSTNSIKLNRLSFSSQTTSFNVYRGANPHQMFRIASDIVLATTFTDIGLPAQLIGPPDENYSTADFYWRIELEAARSTNIFSSTTIGNDNLSLISNVYKGKLVRILKGKGAGQERLVAANDSNTFAMSEQWNITPDSTSVFAVTEPTWVFAATTPVSPAVFEVPNRQGVTIEISGRASNANGKECAYELSPLTRWILGGASGLVHDLEPPDQPVFLLITNGDGQVYLNSVAFSNLQNTHTVQSGTLTVYFTDELSGPWVHTIVEPLDETTTTVTLNLPRSIEPGQLFQIQGEIFAASESLDGGLRYTVTRGMFGTAPEAHGGGSTIYYLQHKVYVVPFARDFFGSPASSSFAYSMDLYNGRVAAADFFVTNIRGNSLIARQNYTATTDFGLRTLSGGQITIQVDGYLSIEDDAAPPISIESSRAIRDIFAMVNEAPTGAPIILRVRQDSTQLATLTIPLNANISNVVNGFGGPPLLQNARLALDIVSVGSSINTVPGSDLSVNIRF